jgi:hypothetical protein
MILVTIEFNFTKYITIILSYVKINFIKYN